MAEAQHQLRFQQVVREVRRRTKTFRTEIADSLGGDTDTLSRGYITPLIQAGVLAEGNKVGHTKPLELNPALGVVVGVEVRVDKCWVAVSDLGYRPLAVSDEVALSIGSPETTLGEIAKLIAGYRELFTDPEGDPAEQSRLVGIAVGLPGPVGRLTGRPADAPVLPPAWAGYDVEGELQNALSELRLPGVRAYATNDASAGALGVHTRGVLLDGPDAPQDLLYVRIVEGIGAGMVLKGHLVTGADGYAGEFGHLRLDPGGPLCPRCGGRGCLETLASESRVVDQLRGAIDGLGDELVEKILSNPHPAVRQAVWEAGWYVGLGVAHAVTLLNPDRIVLHGALTRQPHFVSAVKQAVFRNAVALVRGNEGNLVPRAGIVPWSELVKREVAKGMPWAGLSPELFGALATVVDELADHYLDVVVQRKWAQGHLSQHA